MSSSYGSTYEGHVPRNKGRIRAVENMQSETIKETKVTNNPQRQTK